MPVVPGRKTDSEKFAGADYTLSIEAMMSDGWALQAGTSHHLGQNFTRAYDIRYTDRNNLQQYPFQTSWGMSTRIIGGLIMAHGDDHGLILPPRVAPIQVVVVPIARSGDEDARQLVETACARLERAAGDTVRLRVDRRDTRPGEKYAHWELRGVPLRIVYGAKDLAQGNVTVVRRVDGEQRVLPLERVAATLQQELDAVHRLTYELDLADGRTLRTRVSHPPDRTNYGPQLWSHILRDQLHCDEATFWACVRDGVSPVRGAGEVRAPGDALPADVVNLLVHRVGVDEHEVAGMSRDEAIQRLNTFWTAGS